MKNWILAGILVVAAVLLTVGLMPVHGEEKIYSTVIRLHVLANSDSAEDQALKLDVRDRVLSETEPLLQNCGSREEAIACLEQNRAMIQSAAEAALRERGSDDPVVVTFGEEEYPERDYDSFCFPSGTYLSMRVCIGDAAGHNWWCCLFPPLCLGTSTVSAPQAEEEFVEVGLTPSQYKIITESDTPVYRVRFRFLELFQKWF